MRIKSVDIPGGWIDANICILKKYFVALIKQYWDNASQDAKEKKYKFMEERYALVLYKGYF